MASSTLSHSSVELSLCRSVDLYVHVPDSFRNRYHVNVSVIIYEFQETRNAVVHLQLHYLIAREVYHQNIHQPINELATW